MTILIAASGLIDLSIELKNTQTSPVLVNSCQSQLNNQPQTALDCYTRTGIIKKVFKITNAIDINVYLIW